MALQTSGAISLLDIQNEFGGSNPIEISEYYRGGTYVQDAPVNSNIPTSGEISLDDFYGAARVANIDIEGIGSGGAGGGGWLNGRGNFPNTFGGNGAESYAKLGSVYLVQCGGGPGGQDGASAGTTGNAGGASNYGNGGAGGNANQAGSPAPGASYGAGGGGGGGDVDSGKFDSTGFGGNGGGVGQTDTYTDWIPPGTTIDVQTPAGGSPTTPPTYDGGQGGQGYIKITNNTNGAITEYAYLGGGTSPGANLSADNYISGNSTAGSFSANNPAIIQNNNQLQNSTTASARLYVGGACTLFYTGNISSERSWDFGRLYRYRSDGALLQTIYNTSGEFSQSGEIVMNAGDYLLYQYRKDGSVHRGTDTHTLEAYGAIPQTTYTYTVT
jgi:hypothetical protein